MSKALKVQVAGRCKLSAFSAKFHRELGIFSSHAVVKVMTPMTACTRAFLLQVETVISSDNGYEASITSQGSGVSVSPKV